MSPNQRELLYKLIDDACTNKQIRAFLRAKKHDGGKVKISGSSQELIGHLRAALDGGIIRVEDLTKLLASGEENGRQHTFLFRLTQQAQSQYRDVPRLREKLVGSVGNHAASLPRFVLQPTERTLSDIRLQPLKNKSHNLMVKWYSSRRVERMTDEKTIERHGDKFILRELKIEEVRLVSIARFLPRGLLELRVPTGEKESRKTCLEEMNQMWEFLEPVFPRDHFVPFKLDKAMKWLVANNGKRGAKHRVSVAAGSDDDGRAEFNPAMEGGSLWKHHRHREAMKKYEDFADMDVYWWSPLNADNEDEEIRSQIGLYETNGVRVGSKRADEEIDYIVNRLWEIGR